MDTILTSKQAAARLGIMPNTLEIWRTKGKGPAFLKADPREPRSAIRYKLSDIEAWENEHICRHTSEYVMKVAHA